MCETSAPIPIVVSPAVIITVVIVVSSPVAVVAILLFPFLLAFFSSPLALVPLLRYLPRTNATDYGSGNGSRRIVFLAFLHLIGQQATYETTSDCGCDSVLSVL